ncbi:trimethylamine methyltransferase family protein [Desulfotruncus alcoholivorax]|uniref:trimethylamine methyltransferase family protein n=1 Tax=Desulfotruncus alcoholivorax TaxID=265477 RepID=UPI0004860932|nr:trimethylamine methyltransferase family protein [Desulfotruncus alcoholivorax]
MVKADTKSFKFLSEQEIEQIHQASLYILENFGVKVDDPDLRNDLHSKGCQIIGDRVKFKPDLVQLVLDNGTREITFTGRSGKKVEVKPGNVISHSTGGIPSILDLETGRKRNATLSDFVKTLRLMDHLDQLDMPCALVYPEDVPNEISQIRQFEHMLKFTTKPIYGPGISSAREAKYIVELFQVFSGPNNSLTDNPMGLVGISPESPLYFPKEITDTMKLIISAGIPTVILSAPIAGISGPFTIAGGVAQMTAEMLAFAAIAYLINPKTPLIYGSRLNYPNMRNGLSIWGLPEVGIGNVIVAQLARHYGFLTDVYGLSCTSCTFDNQMGYEKAINGILPVIAGANMISGFGSMANLMVASYEQLAIDNETFAMLRKVHRGVQVNPDTLALDVISSVLNGGTFLAQEHTVRHLRGGEIFMPKLGFDYSWSQWEAAGQKDIRMKARELVQEILKNDHYEPLAVEQEKEVDTIVEHAYQELVSK